MEKKCCICRKEFNGFGNNAFPIQDGTCCDDCNITYVVPARFIKGPVHFEIARNEQSVEKIFKKLITEDFEEIVTCRNDNFQLYKNPVTDEKVMVCIL